MIQISYISRTHEPLNAEELLQLLLQCRKNNRESGVTGMLLYGNGTFLQAIEGEEAVIDELVTRIRKDPRHADIQFLNRRTIERREYPDWSMGFEQVTDVALKDVKGLNSFGAVDFSFDYLAENEPVVESLMEHYRQPNWDPLIREIDAKDKVIVHLKDALAKMRDRAQIARLALESVTQAHRDGTPSDALLDMCDAAVGSLRPH